MNCSRLPAAKASCAPDGKRPTIRLGKVSLRVAEAVKFRVEQLLAAKLTRHAVDAGTARWVAELPDALANKLAAVGLLPKRESATLGLFLDAYIAARSDAKPSTKLVWGHTRRCLVEHLGAENPLREITPGDADAWRLWLAEHEQLAENTVNRRCGIAKQFFRAAFRRKLIAENPFADMKGCAVRGNKARDYFLSRTDAAKVLDALPRCPVAAPVRPEPLRGPAMPFGTLGLDVARRGLGARASHDSGQQDGTPCRRRNPHDPDFPRTTAAPGSRLGAGLGRR